MARRTENKDDNRILVHTCRNGEIVQNCVTRKAYQALDPYDVDFHCDLVSGRYVIRTQDGRQLDYAVSMPGIGENAFRLLEELMWRPGEMRSRIQLAKGTGNPVLVRPNCLAGCLSRLRHVFGETGLSPYFFLTRRHPFAICWNAERSWRFIEWPAEVLEE